MPFFFIRIHPLTVPIFTLWGKSHQIVLLLTTIALLFILWVSQWKKRNQKWVRYAIAMTLVSHILTYHVWHLHRNSWNVQYALPFQISWFCNYLTIAALLSRNDRLMQITYYLGTWSALSALILPALGHDFPTFDFFDFFISHAFILVGVAYIGWVEKIRMTYQTLWVSFATVLGLAICAYIANWLTGANYMFLKGIPNTEAFLPSSPYHLPVVAIAILVILHLQYLPYFHSNPK